ncbi:hypothetical protein D3C71_2034060 [compost metagenome]
MSHRNPVINPDGVEFEWNAAGFTNGIFNNFTKLLQVNMTRYDIDVRVTYRDKRLAEILFFYARCTEQTPVWCAVKPLFDHIGTHFIG